MADVRVPVVAIVVLYDCAMLALDAYAVDCRLFGRVEAGDGRLTEFLNRAPELSIRDARLESLADGHLVEIPELTVAPDELCAVVAREPRGDAARRLRTHAIRVEVSLGPYRIVGLVHGTPASDPLALALRRAPWVPLTEASVTYRRGLDTVNDDVPTLLINRTLASLFRPVEEARVDLPWDTPRAPLPVVRRAFELRDAPRDDRRSDGDETDPPVPPEPQ